MKVEKFLVNTHLNWEEKQLEQFFSFRYGESENVESYRSKWKSSVYKHRILIREAEKKEEEK